MGKRVALHNLGCKVNAYELDRIAGTLVAQGYEIVPFSEPADIYIVNTCTVTNIADRKSRQMLHRAKKNNPEAVVVALGCYVDTDGDQVKKDPCIDIALGNRDKAGLVSVLEAHAERNAQHVPSGDAWQEAGEEYAYRSRTRAYLKIQDGCNLFCSYCIIPYARGRSVSRPVQDVLREAQALAAEGVKEVVLTGIHLTSYEPHPAGEHNGNAAGIVAAGIHPLAGLVQRINDIEGIERIRLGSLEPRMMTAETVGALQRADKLCPHFHLSLQSGSDTVLQRMRRHYTTAEFAKSVALLREAFDNPAITTDLIAGFPGETEAEFEEGRRFVEQIAFYETHVFPFSARKGTPAAGMEGQLTQKEKAARADVLIRMSRENARLYRADFLGRPLSVLWEEKEEIGGKTFLTGHSDRYVKVALAAESGIVYAGDTGIVTPASFLTDEVLFAEGSV